MSLLAIIFIAIVIPFVIIFLGFTWFFIRSRIAKVYAVSNPGHRGSTSLYRTRATVPQPMVATPNYISINPKPSLSYKPTYKPLSHFLDTCDEVSIFEDSATEIFGNLAELTLIPGVTKEIEQELLNIGYTSIEQIARWGRADVRAVSADLDIDQQLIEDTWIPNARLILSVRSTSYSS